MKLVLASGVFDLLHPGHLHYLKEASKLGDRLHVLIARDKNVNRPLLFKEEERRGLVSAVDVVDATLLGYKPANEKKVIKDQQPQIIALGYDQSEDKIKEAIKDLDLNIDVIRITPYRPEKFSASKLKQKLVTESKVESDGKGDIFL